MRTVDAETPARPIEALAAAVDRTRKADFLHRGDEAGKAMSVAVAVLEDLDARVGEIEARLNAIEHPARRRAPADPSYPAPPL